MAAARELLSKWSDVSLDDADRRMLGDELWAITHTALGVMLRETPLAPRRDALMAAMAHFQAALKVYHQVSFPREWARIQNNLGHAYADLPTGDRAENLRRAIACYEAVRCTKSFRGDRAEDVGRAIACYQEALRVLTEPSFPVEWAGTQRNLARALLDLAQAAGDESLLRRAQECGLAAIRGYGSAGLHEEKAKAIELLADIDVALAALSPTPVNPS
jgi:tetratricopeptide (TPR) repeat protein